jgi:alpha,alpha-trehalose phosphorylase
MAAVRYVNATGDEGFDRTTALPLLVNTARLWASVGHHDTDGRFRIDGVTGPDEYSALADNNTYTNLMAQRNLRAAAAVVERHREAAAEFDVDDDELHAWRAAADMMTVPWDEELRVHPQADAFTRHARLDFAALGPDAYPLLMTVPYQVLYRTQVVKQADLVLALHLCGDSFSAEDKRRNFEFYEAITVRDSSLSAATQAVVAAETGHLDLALDYAAETALIDLRDLAANTRDGLHMAALAGTWQALVAGFGGLRDHDGRLSFAPRLPRGLTGLRFALLYRGARLRVAIGHDEATYTLETGDEPLSLVHHGAEFALEPKESVSRPVPVAPHLPRPKQPAGREPLVRHG